MKKIYKPLRGLASVSLCLFVLSSAYSNQYTVINNSNSGAGSLNEAISLANANPGADTVLFAIPEGNSMTIALTSALPSIDQPLFINGYSQPGSSAGSIASRVIRINIDGVGLPIITNIFNVNSTGVSIAGLAIYRAPNFSSGIYIANAASAHIWGNYIGTDSTGLATGLGCAADGVTVNTFNGTPNSGTIIGTDGNSTNDSNEGNLVCSNIENGILLWRTETSKISGNIIGFNKNATGSGFGNGRNGVLLTVSSDGNVVGTDGDGVSDNVEGNRIGNNAQRGVLILAISNGNVVAGNIIGLDASDVAAPNALSGVEINPGSSNRIGTNGDFTSDALEGNTICSNLGNGVLIVGGEIFGFSSNSNNNIVAGNHIGTNSLGTLVRGNSVYGVFIQTNTNRSAVNNIIGTNEDGNGDDFEGNRIANNQKGVVIDPPVAPSTADGNRISRNSIYDNTNLGIDLGNDNVSANDNNDPDTGPNEYFNFPVITRANVQGGRLVVTGIASASALIEFYIADGNGSEGRTYLFSAQEGTTYNGVTDDSTGTDSYSDPVYGTFTDQRFGFSIPVASLPAGVPAGSIIVSLAIKTGGANFSSSEFGPNFISTLPVRFTQFNGRSENGIVYLNWNTSEEINNSHFDVERSGDGTSFEKIGSVKALGGINNNYSFSDTKAGLVNFYRLKQVDNSGASTLSRVILIRGDLDKIGAKASPNPFRANLNVSFQLAKEETVTIRVYNQTGQLVKQQTTKASAGVNTVNVNDLAVLPAGNYTVEVRTSKSTSRQQIVKQ